MMIPCLHVDNTMRAGLKVPDCISSQIHWHRSRHKRVIEFFSDVVPDIRVFKREQELVRANDVDFAVEPPAALLRFLLVVQAGA